jgi:3-deoxy-manno-octulosonate cytidylyltransferase (CMP-KDO synthetase)
MVVWVAERAMAASCVDRVIVATDDERIKRAVNSCGFEAVLTRGDHVSGTDRLAEVTNELPDFGIVVNVQGDEPLISPKTIEQAVKALIEDPEAGIATTWEPIESTEDLLSPDVVKIVIDGNGRAIYFSRSVIPYPREAVQVHGSLQSAMENKPELLHKFKKHTGLYVFRRDVLLLFSSWAQTDLEKTEGLEQLRALDHGIIIRAVQASSSSIGVDTHRDLARVQAMMET